MLKKLYEIGRLLIHATLYNNFRVGNDPDSDHVWPDSDHVWPDSNHVWPDPILGQYDEESASKRPRNWSK